MSILAVLGLCIVMVGTSLLSGVFGMAGGMVLIGVLLAFMPLPAAMALHAVTQMASNGWRALLWWREVEWRIVKFYVTRCAVALIAWSLWRYVPSKPVALIFLGVVPFLSRLLPQHRRPDPTNPLHTAAHGVVCMMLLLLTGVAGPLLDQFFLGGGLDRRRIIATKGVCQLFGHAAKLLYFGAIVDQTATVDPWIAAVAIASSMLGTSLSKKLLEAMSDLQYRLWAGRIVTGICGCYVAYGAYLMVAA